MTALRVDAIDLHSIARALGGDVAGRQVVAPGPGHSPRDRSLAVRFETSAPDGFLVHSFCGDDPIACKDHVRAVLGWSRNWRKQDRAPMPKRRAYPDDRGRVATALRLWREARPIEGTDTARYLVEHRGLDVSRLDLDHCLRWHEGRRMLVALMTGPSTNEPTGIHRTMLDQDARKITRKMLGRKGAIRLCADENVTLGLGICEGIEDGLAIMLDGWRPVWAAGDAGAIERFPVLAGIEALTIFADADTAGMRAAIECAGRWRAAGKEARIMPPVRGVT